ncbi:helix-turn-helix domain-containing protein [Streptomyces sp. NPDC001941]|uniref:helix-turn-helix domain-containing protein n=1 Tax=Streptomyces sp. NPDC001941 TaxID=3154659 RepID=UPI0033202164
MNTTAVQSVPSSIPSLSYAPRGAAPAASPAGAGPAQDSTPLGSLIRAHRLRIGLTQRELADLSTISVRAIRDLEQGKARRPRTDTIRLMADALRLGPRARAALEAAAQQGRGTGGGWAEPPAPPTALHAMAGRAGEEAVLVGELAGATERLVNVVGLAGSGKTRLALAVAERLHGKGLPVLWHAFPGSPAEYLSCHDRELTDRLTALVAHLFGFGPGPDGSAAGDAAALAELLGEAPALLVLDGSPSVAPRVDRLTGLLRACPGLRVLVTSDAPWGVPGERIFLLSSLEVPEEGEDPGANPAVRVFLDHARRARPEFTAGPDGLERAAGVCRVLDGHPGALAAAASWLVVYDLAALCRTLAEDPAALLDHLGGAGGAGLRGTLLERLGRLPEGPRALLDALCAAPGGDDALRAMPGGDDALCATPGGDDALRAAPGGGLPGPDRGRELADLTALTGLALPECGRLLRELLLSGAVRAEHRDGTSRFRVLGPVRAAWAQRAGATAAAR